MTDKLQPMPGPSMRAFEENWPALREVFTSLGTSCAEATAAAEQVMAAWKAARSADDAPTTEALMASLQVEFDRRAD